jgi:hypothetical protein
MLASAIKDSKGAIKDDDKGDTKLDEVLEPSVDVTVMSGRRLATMHSRTHLQHRWDELPSDVDTDCMLAVVQILERSASQLLIKKHIHRPVRAGGDRGDESGHKRHDERVHRVLR